MRTTDPQDGEFVLILCQTPYRGLKIHGWMREATEWGPLWFPTLKVSEPDNNYIEAAFGDLINIIHRIE